MRLATAVMLVILVVSSLALLSTSTDVDLGSKKPTLSVGIQNSSSHIAMTFAHVDHAKQQCVDCHHNYLDQTGQGLCLECHHSDQGIAFKMRSQFHQLCMGCHQKKRSEGEASGPLRNCKACHTPDHAP